MSLERSIAEASVSVLAHLKSQILGLEGQLTGAERAPLPLETVDCLSCPSVSMLGLSQN